MAHSDWIPPREQDLVDLTDKWTAVLSDTAKQTAYGWNAEECEWAAGKIGDFTAARKAYEANKSPENLLVKDEARKAVVTVMRDFANAFVRFNKKMTDADRLVLGIHPRDPTPTTVPAPSTIPVITEIRAMPGQQVRLHFRDQNTETGEAIPPGFNGCILNYTWSPARVDDKALITHRTLMTGSPYLLKLPAEAQGSWLSCYAQWQNRKGDEGPGGDVQHSVIA
jgi:hypothetical protein